MRPIREGMFGIELKVIDTQERQKVDQSLQGRPSGNTIPADIQHEAPNGEVGPIANLDAREPLCTLILELEQRGFRIAQARRISVSDLDTRRSDLQFESLFSKTGDRTPRDRLRLFLVWFPALSVRRSRRR
mgnify:CR=1 FL=1